MSAGTSGLRPGWILGAKADVAIFTGPILAAFALIYYAHARGVLHDDMPPWMFALLIVACDVAHVYATAFRVYLDPVRFKRRPGLYVGVPVMCFAAGVLLYSAGPGVFWRVLAYLALWHFVRQQWGWVAFSRARAGEGNVDRGLDQVTIYTVTVYPVLYWHANLPREFHWFIEGDFAGLPRLVAEFGRLYYWAVVGTFTLRQAHRIKTGQGVNVAKLQIIGTTWIAWYGGIVALDSDIAFTALNVLSHGVPYLAVVWAVEREYAETSRTKLVRWFTPRAALLLLGVLVLVGYAEEWLWDGLVWHEHEGLFPLGLTPEEGVPIALLAIVVPLLAVPQATHYVLDGWLWRRREHPDLRMFAEEEGERHRT